MPDPSAPTPELVLYDLKCTKDVCFSPTVWKIRLMLNYKQIPYRTEWLEFPDIKGTLAPHVGPLPAGVNKYTVPTIHHLASDTWLMDSAKIAPWLEQQYPQRPVIQSAPLSDEVIALLRSAGGKAQQVSLTPREPAILSPRAKEYFVNMVEGLIGHPLQQLLEYEDGAWAGADEGMKQASELMMKNKDKGEWIEGAEPSIADFFLAGAMQCARAIHEGTWEREYAYEGFKRVYDACGPLLERGSY